MSLKIDRTTQTRFDSLTFQIETAEGIMFVTIIDDNNGKPFAFDIKIGKAGATLQAWAHVFARVMTLALDHGATLESLVTELSSQHSDRKRSSIGGQVTISSGPEAICYALMQYRKTKFEELKKLLGVDEDDGRSSRIGTRITSPTKRLEGRNLKAKG